MPPRFPNAPTSPVENPFEKGLQCGTSELRGKGGQPRAQLEKVVRSALACSSSSQRRVDAEPKKTCG